MRDLSPLGMAALDYAAHGLAVFPCEPRGKAPLISRGFKDRTTDAAIITRWWQRWPDANIGAVPADVGCVALDIDAPQHHDAAAALGVFSEPSHVVTTGKGVHAWFRHDDPEVTALGEIIVRSGKGYVMMPPSVHPSGAVYSAETTIADAIPLPERAVAALTSSTPGSTAPTAPAAASDGPILEGGRNVRLAQLAGRLAGRMAPDLVAAALHGINATECRPPLPAAEVEAIARSITTRDRHNHPERYAPGADLGSLLAPAAQTRPVGPRGRTLFTPSELMDEPESVPFIVDNALPVEALAAGWGPSGCGKTFAVFDMAMCIATGLSWLGREVTRGDVVYVCGEGYRGLRSRLAAWCAEHGFEPSDLDGHLAIRRVPWALTDDDTCTAVREEVTAHALTPVLIVLDTLSANAPAGFKENGIEDMKTLMDAARRLRDEYHATVLFVHHTGHDTSRMRGSTDLFAALDVSFGIKRVGKTTRQLTFDKARDFAPPDPILFDLAPAHGSLVVRSADAECTPMSAHDPVHVELLQILRQAGRPLGANAWCRESGRGRGFFYAKKAELVAAQYVMATGRTYQLTATGTAVLDAPPESGTDGTDVVPGITGTSDPSGTVSTPFYEGGLRVPNRDHTADLAA
jgi:hypothetical protein